MDKQNIKVIKGYAALKASLKTPADLSYEDDFGVAEFRAFGAVGIIHAQRVRNPLALDTMLEVIEDLQTCLQDRKKLVI